MIIKQLVLDNINVLQHELAKLQPSILQEIVSVIIDGSIVRGDFCEHASDIDITITSLSSNIDLYIKHKLEETIKYVQSKLPIRKYPEKPLIYDIQWQNINIVKTTGERQIQDWKSSNIPEGYPKLWLYAFDSIRYHSVILGDDVTELYSKIPARCFTPLRLERLKKSVEKSGGNISKYEAAYGAITQIKNAWETIRCICIANGLTSIKKNDVIAFATKIFKAPEEVVVLEGLIEFYIHNNHQYLMNGSFRNRLSNFTLTAITDFSYKD